MKAKQLCSIMLAVALVLLFTSQVLAAEDLTDWEENIWQGNITLTPDGTKLDVKADGSAGEAWRARYKYFPKAAGVLATVNVSAVSGDTAVGLRKYLGRTSANTQILAEIMLDHWDGEKRIFYRVRERDDEGNTIRQIAAGALGDWDGTWSPGQNITIALARIVNEIWFFTPGNGAFVKVMPFEILGKQDSDVQIYGYTQDGAANSVVATVSNVTILYVEDLEVFPEPDEALRELLEALVEAFVTRFYQLCLGRDPDAAGLAAFVHSLLNQTQSGSEVAHFFINSKEFKEKQTSNPEYLTILYEAFFNRKPDQAGWDLWMKALNEGQDRNHVLNGFLDSYEFFELCAIYGIKPK